MKHKIEKDSVQETLIIPLYARKMCSELFPRLYRDDTAAKLLADIDYDFSEAAAKSAGFMQRFGFLEVAMRQNDLAWEIRDYLSTLRRRRWSISAVALTIPAEPAITDSAEFTIWIFRT